MGIGKPFIDLRQGVTGAARGFGEALRLAARPTPLQPEICAQDSEAPDRQKAPLPVSLDGKEVQGDGE
jgi:hypothetical protein